MVRPLASVLMASASETPEHDEAGDSNLELDPVLSVLTDEQKNLLICQAIQKDPSLVELLLQKAAEQISPEDAATRVEALDAAAAVQAVRSFMEIDGAELNALTMLVALTEAVREALHELGEKGADWQDSAAPPRLSP